MLHLTIELVMPTGPVFVNFTFDAIMTFSLSWMHRASEPDLVQTVRKIVSSNRSVFDLCEQGTGGTYFVKDANDNRIAVFKPDDEEPGSLNNPKNKISPPSTPLLAPGGGAVREVVAYLLDRGNRAGVPETHLLSGLQHPKWVDKENELVPKTGSLQKFIPHLSAAADMGSSLFSVDNVHNIGIFDLRFLNLDRNGENLLVVKEGNQHKLIPIDHSYILPPQIQTPFFEWMYWKQAKVPFSPETLKYISEINIEEDARLLSSFGIPPESILTMKICSVLLKKCAAAGYALFQIACLVCSQDESKSALESIVDDVKAENCASEEAFFLLFDKLVDSVIVKSCK